MVNLLSNAKPFYTIALRAAALQGELRMWLLAAPAASWLALKAGKIKK